MQARVEKNSEGRIAIHGDLSFDSVPGVWAELQALFSQYADLDLELARVERSDSAGLALLVECQRLAGETGRNVRFFNIPDQMLAIARVSGLDEVLPLQHD